MIICPKVKQIKINGFCPVNTKLYAYLKPHFINLIPQERKKYSFKKGEEAGSRFLNNESVWYRIISGLWNARWEPFDLSQEEIRYLIRHALKDCASADYYYHWEKDWE